MKKNDSAAGKLGFSLVAALGIIVGILAISSLGCSPSDEPGHRDDPGPLARETLCPRVESLIKENVGRLAGFIQLAEEDVARYASSVACLSCHPDEGRGDYTTLRPRAEFLRQPALFKAAFPTFTYDPTSIVCYQCHTEAGLLQVPNPDAQMIEMNDYVSTAVFPGWLLEAGEWKTDFRGDGWQDADISNGGYDSSGQGVVSTSLSGTVLDDINSNGEAGWVDDQWAGYLLVPDDESPLNRYPISGNTDTSITISSGDMLADGAMSGDRYRIEIYYPIVGGTAYNMDSLDSNFHYDHMIRYPLIYGSWFEVTCTKCHAVDPATFEHDGTTGHPAFTREELDFERIDQDLAVGGDDEGGWTNAEPLYCMTVCHPSTTTPFFSNSYYRDARSTIEGGNGCLGCHEMEMGSRRQVAGDGGDFQRSHHHVTGGPEVLQPEDCVQCHYVGNHNSQTVYVKNVDSGENIAFTSEVGVSIDPDKQTEHCLSCHDADGADGDVTPFSDGQTVPNIDQGGLWAASAHATGGTTNAGYSCFGDGATTGCHGNAHGSNLQKLLQPYDGDPGGNNVNEEEGFCYTCHGTVVINEAMSNGWFSGAYQNFSDNIAEAFGLTRSHPVNDSAAGHTFDLGQGAGPQELECTSCHGVHQNTGKYWDAASDMTPVDLFSTGVLWGDDPEEKTDQYETSRVYAATSIGQPGNDLSGLPLPIDGAGNSLLTGPVLPDYNTMCLSCHQYAVGSMNAIDWAGKKHGSADAEPEWDLIDPTLRTGFPLVAPYDSGSKGQYYLSCTDCHEAHGSENAWLIRRTHNGDEMVDQYGAPVIITEITSKNYKAVCDSCHDSVPQQRHHNVDVMCNKMGFPPYGEGETDPWGWGCDVDCTVCHFVHGASAPYESCVTSGCHGHGDYF